MPHEKIFRNIARFVTLKPEEKEIFRSLLKTKKIKKKEFLLKEGDICTDDYYVNNGCLRTYFIDRKGLEHNLHFAIEDSWSTDLYSRTQMAPMYCNIIALEDTEVIHINHQMLEGFMEKVPVMERFFRLCYEQSLVNQHLKNLQMLYMTAEEYYVNFRQRYPKLINRIPQKHIATFLGLTPEFFNTIHAKVTRSKSSANIQERL